MGRLLKQGLDFFPLSVTLFEDDKIRYIGARFDERGELLVVKLFQEIYRHKGYYMNWDNDEAALFAKSAGKNISPGLAIDVVNELLKRGFFDEDIHKRLSILTSYNIQRTYEKICKDSGRKGDFIKPEHKITAWNEHKKSFPVEETELTGKESTQTKGKETKLNETKGVDVAETREEVFKKNLLADRIYLERECIKNKIEEDKYLMAVEDFFADKKNNLEDKLWPNESDCRKNFMYWIPKYLAAKSTNGYVKKLPDSTVYIPPKIKEDHQSIIPTRQQENEGFQKMVDEDLKKIKDNSECKIVIAAMKLDWLISNKKIILSIEEREQYYAEAQNQFIQSLADSHELVSSRATMDYYKANKSFRSEDQSKIKVVAKELAYMNFLKSNVTETTTP